MKILEDILSDFIGPIIMIPNENNLDKTKILFKRTVLKESKELRVHR